MYISIFQVAMFLKTGVYMYIYIYILSFYADMSETDYATLLPWHSKTRSFDSTIWRCSHGMWLICALDFWHLKIVLLLSGAKFHFTSIVCLLISVVRCSQSWLYNYSTYLLCHKNPCHTSAVQRLNTYWFFSNQQVRLYLGVRTCETHGWRKTKETKTF